MDILRELSILIAGVALGLACYRKNVESIIGREPMTRCDYCEFKRNEEKLHLKR